MTGTLLKKSKLILVSATLLAITLVFALLSSAVFHASAEGGVQEPTKRTINVSGSGKVNASPDIAYITLGVLTQNADAKTAQADNAAIMDKVIAAVKAAGVDEKDIKTVSYSIQPTYKYDKDTYESYITGYSVNNSVQVTVRDILKTGNVIDAAVQNGANISGSIAFGLSDYDKYYNEALKNAINNAKGKAKTIAETLGVSVSVPVTVTESGGGYYTPIYRNYNLVAADEKAADVSTPVSSGTIEVSANVSMTYEY